MNLQEILIKKDYNFCLIIICFIKIRWSTNKKCRDSMYNNNFNLYYEIKFYFNFSKSLVNLSFIKQLASS